MQVAYSGSGISKLNKKKGVVKQWKVDSAAIGVWHVGKPPDKRAIETLRSHNIEYNGRCRVVCFLQHSLK